ncbi:uncharacterized protein [Chaetodon trifascialis]|uniref:uncharacterized protein n=1 Tax=Chaetodon trifascialis TaxID=109706 RepID=UPI0039917107
MNPAILCAARIWHGLQEEVQRSRRRRARLRRILLLQQVRNPPLQRYRQRNLTVPVLRMYFDGESELLMDYHLTRASMDAVMRLLPPEGSRDWEQAITVLITVYWLAHGLSYSVVSRAFEVPLTTVYRLVHKGVKEIAALRQDVIRFPTAQELEDIGHSFQVLAHSPVFASCVGAIDGCHVRIKTPPGPDGQDYYNRKLFPSIQLQAVCDGRAKFLNTFVGYPGSVHDKSIKEQWYSMFKSALYPPQGYFIVGDGGYPCISHPVAIITPYREPLQGRVQSRFNNHHAFGMLKTRWRSLLFRAIEVDHTFAPTVITACAVLHNICLTAGDIIEPTLDPDNPSVPPSRPVRWEQSASAWRDRLAAQLSAPPVRISALQEHDY